MLLANITSTKKIIGEIITILTEDFPVVKDYLAGITNTDSFSTADIVNVVQKSPETLDIRLRSLDTYCIIEKQIKSITNNTSNRNKLVTINFLDEDEYCVMLSKAIRTMAICNGKFKKNCYVYHVELLQESKNINIWRHLTYNRNVRIEDILKKFDHDRHIPIGTYKISLYQGKNEQEYSYSELEYEKN